MQPSNGSTSTSSGRRALDAGASTGGFTDCLLQAGAASVVAVDVGRGQLHPRFRDDPRVESRERLDIRNVTLDTVGGSPVDLVTADLSFISVTRAVPDPGRRGGGPGFAAGCPGQAPVRSGPYRSVEGERGHRRPGVHRRTLADVAGVLAATGAEILGLMPSPITGSAGNIEFLLHARAPDPGRPAGRRDLRSPLG